MVCNKMLCSSILIRPPLSLMAFKTYFCNEIFQFWKWSILVLRDGSVKILFYRSKHMDNFVSSHFINKNRIIRCINLFLPWWDIKWYCVCVWVCVWSKSFVNKQFQHLFCTNGSFKNNITPGWKVRYLPISC